MGQVAEDMLGGVCCEACGEFLMCEDCEDNGIPAYCSWQCAKSRGAGSEQVCDHIK